MSVFDIDLAQIIQKYVIQKNLEQVKIINNQTIKTIEGNGTVQKVILSDGKEIQTDMVILSAGIRANSELAKDCGIELGETGAIKVNSRMQTNIEDIYACGDCVEKYHIVAQAPCWLPLGSTANKEGRCCAINVSGGFDEFEGVLGSAVTKYFDFTMSMTGLTEREAEQIGFTPVSVTIEKPDKVAFMPDASDITLKVIADKITGLILGGQAIGSFGADKRINSLATALLAHMTVNSFKNNDLTYSPPYSTTIDPLLDAMTLLCKKLSDHCD